MSSWQKFVAVTAFLSLSVPAFSAPSTAYTTTAESEGVQRSTSELTLSQQKGEYQLAQTSSDCRRVSISGGSLNVRSSPGGGVVGTLRNQTLVTIENTGSDGWVPISSPVQGYVSANYLESCEEPVSPSETETLTDNCRQVVLEDGALRVRQEPASTSSILGLLQNEQRVTITERPDENGWVPISSPVDGYIPASYLKYCS